MVDLDLLEGEWKVNEMKVNLISYTKDPEKVVTTAAKLCYSNAAACNLFNTITDTDCEKFLSKLSSMGHQSPLEHASFTFAIEGVSRSLLAQITRHRIASFSVQSQRYVNMSDKFNPVIPREIEMNPAAMNFFTDAMDDCLDAYNRITDVLVDTYMREKFSEQLFKEYDLVVPPEEDFVSYCAAHGVSENSEYLSVKAFALNMKNTRQSFKKKAQENARAVLPNACPTQMIVTMNARELLHFFELRCCNRAQEEIRTLAWEMLSQVKEVAPHIFKDAGPSCMRGLCSEGTMTCGKPYRK